jgi:NTP pyrophosphatase (non-canonical NTP hydrolase)
MNREEFKIKLKDMINTGNGMLYKHTGDLEKILDQSIEKLHNDEIDMIKGFRNIIIILEELGELNKELTKALRNKQDRIGIIEETADVLICIEYIKKIFNITEREINSAIYVKANELKNKLDSNNFQ